MLRCRSLLSLAICLGVNSALQAELPLPDATFFGHVATPDGTQVGSGVLTARVQRGNTVVLTVPGVFMAAEGEIWFVARIPLETNIGAPGPGGVAAREGDALSALLLDGRALELKSVPPALKAGLASRLDATATDIQPPGLLFFRGDCSPDLQLSISDAVRVLNFLFVSPEAPPCLAACDGDGSGALNITDGVYLLSFLFLGGPAPPEPGPQCGIDPTPGQIGCAQTDCAI